ncbi:MAG: DUF3313 family protein [Chitinophagaceae bacterium]|nr:MAG: DUF3313 family protein [Chitinophagaceae bacterium]
MRPSVVAGGIVIGAILFLSACGTVKPNEKAAAEKATNNGLSVVAKPRFDSTFIASTMRFEQYKNLKIDPLDLTNVKIIESSMQRSFDKPWELTDEDRRYYQEKYLHAARKNLIDTGLYSTEERDGKDTLLLTAKVLQIAPLGPKDDFTSRPNLMDVYSEGFGRMTISFEVYDSETNKLLLTATDERDLGKIWEKNNRAQNKMQIRLAFDYWLSNLKTELEHAAKK